ncbi:MAG: hypothetical protein FJ317_06490, partial [SAR202 cluster bacterium]|nr:hypothetical protein [SAR202 cluster bacterium]
MGKMLLPRLALLGMLCLVLAVACKKDEPERTPQPIRNSEIEPALEAAVTAAARRLTPSPEPTLQRPRRSRVFSGEDDREAIGSARDTHAPSVTMTAVPQARLQGSSTGPPAGREVRVVRVIDGDTIDVQFPNESFQRIRLIGVDTPETNGENQPLEFGNITNLGCLDRWGAEAAAFASDVLLDQTVVVEYDERVPVRDTFGRLLAYVHVEGADFGADLLVNGLARVFAGSGSSRENTYMEHQADAQNSQRGLWVCRREGGPVLVPTTPEPLDPALGVRQGPVIECVFYNGTVPLVESDEYVQIGNLGAETVNLGGWTLVDSDGDPAFTFPPYDLPPGRNIRVYTNELHGESGWFTFGFPQALWGNDTTGTLRL